ncbi:MAG: hypothetical protein K0R51_2755 [Cytophagaceae bacterium]|jgi:hypothetical protein|nr:hypothetical protein [Cytophagaceae bacterium]
MKENKKHLIQKDLIFSRNAILVGIAVICISLYPLYKNHVFPKHSDLVTIQDKLKNLKYHKGAKGGTHLILTLNNHPEIDFEISGLALNHSDNDFNDLKTGDFVSIEISKTVNLNKGFLPIKVYSLRTSHRTYLSLETHLAAAHWNNNKFLIIIIISGLIIIILALLFRRKKIADFKSTKTR